MSKELTIADSEKLVYASAQGEVLTDSLRVARDFGKRHGDALRQIARLECSAEFNQRNFAPIDYLDGKGRTQRAISMTRDGFTFLAMGFTGRAAAVFKERYIAAFNAMAAHIQRQAAVDWNNPNSVRAFAAQAALKAADLLEANAVLLPKAAALDRVSAAEGSLCISDAAKTLKLDPLKRLFDWLRENKWTFKRGNNWRARQSKIDAGMMEHKYELTTLPNGREMLTTQARITSKGLAALALLFPTRSAK